MVKRTPPLAIAVIGTGETSPKNVEAQLNDFTAQYADVTFVLPVDDEHWTPTLDAVADWVKINEIPYVAVTDGSSPSKALVPLLEGAEETIKVARVSTKVVQLLAQQVSEGEEAALLVAWDDDDPEANLAVQKALDTEIPALNLLNGLEPFEFEDEDEDDGEEVRQEPAEKQAPARRKADDDGDVALTHADGTVEVRSQDDYDNWGIRKLRAALREREGHGFTDRQIGQMEKDDAVEALRALDRGASEPQEAEEPQEETRTTRARRAFAEGASEGQDEARPLPRSKGSDLLENEGDEDWSEGRSDAEIASHAENRSPRAEIVDKGITSLAPEPDHWTRQRALELAVQTGAGPDGVIPLAIKMETYLKGERASAGRPRADGTPAQPREIREDGKPVRRRPSRSTE